MNAGPQLYVREPNWLPLPGVTAESEVYEEPTVVDENDNFSKARVEEYYPRQGYGFIKLDNGDRVRFDLNIVRLVGEKAEGKYIREGARIGFDMSETPQGPRVSILKIY